MKPTLSFWFILGATLAVAGCDSSATVCDADAGAPRVIAIASTESCVSTPVSIPRRHDLQCGALPSDFVGSRFRLEGRARQNWRLTLDRTDGSPEAVCAAVLDDMCRCVRGDCTANAAEARLVMDLGYVEESAIEVVLPAGTYQVELCSRPMS